MEIFQIGLAFYLGLMSFASPCVLPMVPGYIGYLFANDNLAKALGTIAIFLGVLLGGSLLGLALSLFGEAGSSRYFYLIASLLVFIFIVDKLGLNLIKPFPFPWLQRRKGAVIGFLFGLLMILVASPCIVPLLAITSILALSISDLFSRYLILISFSFGLGLPFIIISQISTSNRKIVELAKSKHLRHLQIMILLIMEAWLLWKFFF